MHSTLDTLMVVFGIGRVLIGLAPFVAAGALSRIMGFPAAHDSPTARLMARWFGVRDIGLGVLAFWATRHHDAIGFVALFNAAMDGGDLVAMAIPLVGRHGIDRPAIRSAAFAVTGAVGWLLVWYLAR